MRKLSIKEVTKKRKKKGFTLIELIIVIAIIAILAAMAIPKFGEVRRSANIKTDVASAKNIQTAVATAIADGKITGADGDVAAKDFQGFLDGDKLPTPKAEGGEFKATITGGNITVTANGKAVYPNLAEGYGGATAKSDKPAS